MSLYVTNIDNPISSTNPAICIPISVFCFSGFLLIASISNINIFPPSNGGNGNRFVTPSDTDITAIMYANSCIPFVSTTISDIPNYSN